MTMLNSPFYHFSIGNLKATVVGDGQAQFPAYPLYAVNASQEAVRQALAGQCLPTESYTLQCNVLYLDLGAEKVLIDTGAGSSLGPALGKLVENLHQAGVEAASVTAILLTHAHLDHVSGITGTDGQLQFPNARMYLSEPEWRFWQGKQVDLSAMPIEEGFRQHFIGAARKNLTPFSDRIVPFRYGQEILPGIQAVDAAGHSPGHAAYLIASGQESLLHAGDVFHHEAFDLEHPDWATAFDQDAKAAYRTRLRMLDRAAADKSFLMGYHVPFPAIGYVRRKGSGYAWEGAPWRF
jgi:glyoxylase-like metal-dependent hydrolase (beta-lactamase superfamily II)